ncbi:MAG TPA: glycoside hydrolase family 125 protein [Pyrinomonadaceae bacterium]|nr:glycoside hydrolase family 125 protein [Pyrinomonadaceae bacterium]
MAHTLNQRREVLTGLIATAATAALTAGKRDAFSVPAQRDFPTVRPAPSQRKFSSRAVEAKIAEVKRAIADPELGWLFESCFPNTLDTTVTPGTRDGRPDTLVITGDINAMWLRDSTAQVTPYVPLARDDNELKDLIAGVINRQTMCILIDRYANAFSFGAKACPWGVDDKPPLTPELCERKWEIDSLCYPVRLAHSYWAATGDPSCFHADWLRASKLIVQTFREQQRLNGPGPYRFQRKTDNPIDTPPFNGLGNPARPVGLIHSAFRPSDDACVYPFLIPANLFAVVALKQLAEILSTVLSERKLADECRALAHEITAAVNTYGKAVVKRYGLVYAYEVDGFGNRLFMDDANVPSLLALPYLGCCAANDPVYRRTRGFVLSSDNPYFFRGRAAEGIGGPHVGLNMIWPLGIIVRALTSTDDKEILNCLRMLKTTHAGTGFMHEAFDKDDPKKFTRSWFAWANTMFGELIVKLREQRPHLLKMQL